MGLNLQVSLPASLKGEGKLGKIESRKESILLAGGQALQKLLRNWMRELNSSRSKHGSNHFTPSGIHDPVIDGNNVSVGIFIPGINRALHDVIIRPVEANALAIPMHADAYGTSPREYNNNHPKGSPDALFRPKGKDYLAKNDNGSLVVMYLLRKSVTQRQDRTLLPPAEEMSETALKAMHGAVEAILST
jgi:hypothetical protein